jgi:murein L,D-transpeptidase YcbB/YkuD
MTSLCFGWRRGFALVLVIALSASPASADEGAVAQAIAQLLSPGMLDPALGSDADALRRFYGQRDDKPAWRRDGTWGAEATAAIAALETAEREGLNPRDYLAGEISRLPESATDAEIARADVQLSAAMLRYAGDVRTGRVTPSAVDSDYAVFPERPDVAAMLAEGLAGADFQAWLSSLPPDDTAYRRLREVLATYRQIAAAGPWPRLPDGPTLKAGATGPEIKILRDQLSRLGDMPKLGEFAGPQDSNAEVLDAGLELAVRHFQSRHGLTADGAVGLRTRAALAVSPQERVATIAVNLERMRWFPHPASGRYVVINTAGFDLTALADGKIASKMPVIVGTVKAATPVFPDEITAVTFMPTWTVPPKIARAEILPKVKRDPDYLAAHNMKVYSGWGADACEVNPNDVDWSSIRPRALAHKFVQQPGESNALGRIRFTIHNEFGIFMHDTPAKNLFGREVRTYSHGCVRVGNAAALAAFVLEGDPDWPPEAIEAAANGSETKTVELRAPVPIEMTYLTAWVDEDGRVQFRPDTYGRDPALGRALFGAGGL